MTSDFRPLVKKRKGSPRPLELPKSLILLANSLGIRVDSSGAPQLGRKTTTQIIVDAGRAATPEEAACRLNAARTIAEHFASVSKSSPRNKNSPSILVDLIADLNENELDACAALASPDPQIATRIRASDGKDLVSISGPTSRTARGAVATKDRKTKHLEKSFPDDPWRKRSQYGSPFGAQAQRILKALILVNAHEDLKPARRRVNLVLGRLASEPKPRTLDELAGLASGSQGAVSKLLSSLAERGFLRLDHHRASLSSPIVGLRSLLAEWLHHEAERDVKASGRIYFLRRAGVPSSSPGIPIRDAQELIKKIEDILSDLSADDVGGQILLGGTEALSRALALRHASVSSLVLHATKPEVMATLARKLALVRCERGQASCVIVVDSAERLCVDTNAALSPLPLADAIELYLDTRHSPRGEEVREELFERVFRPLCEVRGWTP